MMKITQMNEAAVILLCFAELVSSCDVLYHVKFVSFALLNLLQCKLSMTSEL
jgi:hypothetical protein